MNETIPMWAAWIICIGGLTLGVGVGLKASEKIREWSSTHGEDI